MYPTEYTAAGMFKNHRDFTFQNWSDGGEIMHYVFLHMPEFFTHSVIHRSGPISELKLDPRDDIANLLVETDRGEISLDDYVRDAPVNGIVVAQAGQIIYERYPRMRPYDKHLLMSVSKIFASAIIGILEGRGKITTAEPVEAYLPEVAGSGWDGVSIQDVLDMASGIACLEVDDPGAYSDPATPYYQYEASLGWLAPTDATSHSTYEYVASLRRGIQPGKRYQYTSPNTFVLSWLAERITGSSYSEIVSELLWSKIGAESDALMSMSNVGASASHGGISTTMRDVARLGMLFTPSWTVVAAEQVISPAHLAKIQTGGRPAIIKGSSVDQPLGFGRGSERPLHSTYQWDWVTEDGDFYKGGYGGQGLYISPARDLVIAYTGTLGLDGESNGLRYVARQIATSGII